MEKILASVSGWALRRRRNRRPGSSALEDVGEAIPTGALDDLSPPAVVIVLVKRDWIEALHGRDEARDGVRRSDDRRHATLEIGALENVAGIGNLEAPEEAELDEDWKAEADRFVNADILVLERAFDRGISVAHDGLEVEASGGVMREIVIEGGPHGSVVWAAGVDLR